MRHGISALILTKNEEIHIERCIKSIRNLVSDIYVIDSGSTDKTRYICEKYNAKFFVNQFYNYAHQFNWGLEIMREKNCNWVLSIDADEFFTPNLINEILENLNNDIDKVSGFAFIRKIIFQGKILNFGGISSRQLRLFKANEGYCENNFMDEHIKVKGIIRNLNQPFYDYCLKDLTWWTNKHNYYSNREIIDMLGLLNRDINSNEKLQIEAKIKRLININIYNKLPLLFRSIIYFSVRYFLFLGFLDGLRGLIYYFLQGFWYRFLIDAKILELKNYSKKNNLSIRSSFKQVLGIDLSKFE